MGDMDLGHGITGRFIGWSPDRELNPQYDGIPDDERAGLVIWHVHEDGNDCEGMVTLDTPVHRQLVARGSIPAERPTWQVVSWEPLHLEPSILRRECGLHGWIRDGRWLPA